MPEIIPCTVTYKHADFSNFESVLDHVPWNIIDCDNADDTDT